MGGFRFELFGEVGAGPFEDGFGEDCAGEAGGAGVVDEVGAGGGAGFGLGHGEGVGDDEVGAGGEAGGGGDFDEFVFGDVDFEFEFDEEVAVVPGGAEFVDEFFGGGGGDGDFVVGGFDLGGGDVLYGPGFGAALFVGRGGAVEDFVGGGGFVVGDGGGHGDDVDGVGDAFFEEGEEVGVGGEGFDAEHAVGAGVAVVLISVLEVGGEEGDVAEAEEGECEVETGFSGEDVAPVADLVDFFAGGAGGDEDVRGVVGHGGDSILCGDSTK